MKNSYSNSYAEAGVDIEAGYRGVELMKEDVRRTRIPGVLSDIGGFGGLFAPDMKGMEEPVLVSGTDGVGTKQRIAGLLDKHDTLGIDCVAMCVNDIVCCGAKPLFFLDYIAIGKNIPEKVAQLVRGVAEGCLQAECALIGGETAEHPGTMKSDDYDLAGFAVGIVDKKKILHPGNVKAKDKIIALPSSGLHANGFSLARKVFDVENSDLHAINRRLGMSLGECLLAPTRIYVKEVLAVLASCDVHGISHITGGGFYENLPRCLPEGLGASIVKENIRTPEIFKLLQETGKISEHDMYNTFNMGVGMVLIVSPESEKEALRILHEYGSDAYTLGEVIPSRQQVCLW